MALTPRKFITQDSFDNAQNKFGHIEISVTNTPVSIKGILKENFSISTEANYDNIFSVSDKFEGARKVLDFSMGSSFLNTGQWTRKYYKGGSYMKITPKFRVVDYEGNNDPLVAAFILMNSSLPTSGKYDTVLDDLVQMSSEQILERFKGSALKLGQKIEDAGKGLVAGDFAGTAIAGLRGLKDLLTGALGNSPNPVSVKVSNFFSWDEMVIDSVNVEFSKEMTMWGPLYVDIDAVLSSREVATKGRTGLERFDSRFSVEPGNGGSN